MKRFIINILLFFAIIAIVDCGVGFVGNYLQSHSKSGVTRKTNDLVINDSHDVLILGSSRACHHYDAPFMSDTLGLDVYNAGFDGNGVILSYGLLAMMLERYQPKLVVFDVEPAFDINVYAADNNHKRYIATLKPYYKDAYVKDVIKDVSNEEWYKTHSGMIRYNTTIITKAVDCIIGGADMDKGYIPLQGTNTLEPKGGGSTPTIDDFKLGYVEKLLRLAQVQDVPIIVVASPKYGMKSSEGVRPVRKICERCDVPFIDYYADDEFMQHKEWFKEQMHLNANGARVFSSRMIGEIKYYMHQ